MGSWQLIAVAALVVAGGVIYALRRFVYGRIADGGAAAYRAERAEANLAVAKRQGEIMAEQKDVEDVAKDLDAGNF
jgi:hypothetical protein